MIKFSKEKVLLLHQLIAEETGGSIGVRDIGLLESALVLLASSLCVLHIPSTTAHSKKSVKRLRLKSCDLPMS